MDKKHSSQAQSIKKKLMAATSMLLVATIMLVSSTYAWFTLSTAPEVTGITTTVGANGSLEIALANKTTWADPNQITSAVGDSSAVNANGVTAANVTWGNLVDLSDPSYGLSTIMLVPSALNRTSGKEINMAAPLSFPEYGADGRVAALSKNTLTGTYDTENNGFVSASAEADTEYGVRAIGSVSSMTPRQASYRSAKSSFSTAMATAKNTASMSLKNNGNELATIIVNQATGSDAGVTPEQLNAIGSMITDLGTSMNNIKLAFNYAALTTLASATYESAIDDTKFTLIEDTFKADNFDVTTYINGTTLDITDVYSITINADLAAAVSQYKSSVNSLSQAKSKCDTLVATNKDSYTWTEVSEILNYLVNTANVKVNGSTVEGFKQSLKNDDGSINVDKAIEVLQNLEVQLYTGSGVFSEISDICGTYDATVTVKEISYGGMTLKDKTAKMKTYIENGEGETRPWLVNVYNAVPSAPTGENSGATASVLTDTYGYILDFYLRTNASGSKLKLQTEAAQRVYSDSSSLATQGGGSYIEFAAQDGSTIGTADVQNMMSRINVVFLDGTNNIIGYAKVGAAAAGTTGIKAPLEMYNVNEDGTIGTKNDSAEIMPLTQNTATKLSVLVYLDGEAISNADALMSQMKSTLNIQFSSTATLTPMENNALRNYVEEETTGGTQTGGENQGGE